MKIACIHKATSLDGFSAAWCFYNSFDQGQIEFRRIEVDESDDGSLGPPPNGLSGVHVVLLGIAYPADVLAQLGDIAASLLVIERHKKVVDRLYALPDAPLTLAEWFSGTYPAKVAKRFDLNRSTGMLAWDFCFPDESAPALMMHLQDVHLRRFVQSASRPVVRALRSYATTMECWSDLLRQDDVRGLTREGIAISRRQQIDAEFVVKQGRYCMRIGGHLVPAANGPTPLANQIGGVLLRTSNEPFVAIYQDIVERGLPQRKVSLRAPSGGIHVGDIARSYGGGGHQMSASFLMPLGWMGDPA